MSVYMIAEINIHDRSEYAKYVAGFRAMFRGFKGEVIIADESVQVIEGDWPWTRIAMLRFDDETEARRWYRAAAERGFQPAIDWCQRNNVAFTPKG